MKTAKPKTGFVIIESVFRKGFKQDKKTTVLPPSDFFVVDGGTTEFKKGQEIVLDGVARLTPLFKGKQIYVVNQVDIIAYYA